MPLLSFSICFQRVPIHSNNQPHQITPIAGTVAGFTRTAVARRHPTPQPTPTNTPCPHRDLPANNTPAVGRPWPPSAEMTGVCFQQPADESNVTAGLFRRGADPMNRHQHWTGYDSVSAVTIAVTSRCYGWTKTVVFTVVHRAIYRRKSDGGLSLTRKAPRFHRSTLNTTSDPWRFRAP